MFMKINTSRINCDGKVTNTVQAFKFQSTGFLFGLGGLKTPTPIGSLYEWSEYFGFDQE